MRAIRAFSSNAGWGESNGWGEESSDWAVVESPLLSPISLPSLVADDEASESSEGDGEEMERIFIGGLMLKMLEDIGVEGNPIVVE